MAKRVRVRPEYIDHRSISVIGGIDPGVKGALAVIDSQRHTIFVADLPTLEYKTGKKTRRRIDPTRLAAMVAPLDIDHIIIESVHSMPAQGIASAFSFGHTLGCLEGVVGALQIPRTLVTPQMWKKHLRIGKDKTESHRLVAQLIPQGADVWAHTNRNTGSLIIHDGRCEAALLAWYGCMELGFPPGKLEMIE